MFEQTINATIWHHLCMMPKVHVPSNEVILIQRLKRFAMEVIVLRIQHGSVIIEKIIWNAYSIPTRVDEQSLDCK